jgi:hypothetical protein
MATLLLLEKKLVNNTMSVDPQHTKQTRYLKCAIVITTHNITAA